MILRDLPEPDVPLHGPWAQVETWLQGLLAGAPTAAEVRWSPVLSDQGYEPGEEPVRESHPYGMRVSWIGGPAAGPLTGWPRRADGRALAHVITLSLGDVDVTVDAQGKAAWPGLREGLPTVGVLEVFHDLESFGDNPADTPAHAWSVRWVPEPDGTLLEAPPDADTPTEVCHALLTVPGFTLPPAEDAVGTDRFEVADGAETALRLAWLQHRTGRSEGHPIPVHHVYGHPSKATSLPRQVLLEALPLAEPDDEHRLLLDLESWTHLDQWFGDAGQLEVWIRDSNLRARDFSRAWCLIRTD